MTNRTIRVGVIGVGGMGGQHARNLAQRIASAEVVALMDLDRDRAETIAAACGGARIFTNAQALIADPAVEAVLIASPHATHAPLTIACIEAGKWVLCEKPLATSQTEGWQVIEAEVAAGHRLVQVGLMRQFDPPHTDLKALLDRGQIGQPLLFSGLHANEARGVRSIEDVIVNSAVHDIHSVRWLMGQEIRRVYIQHVPVEPSRPETCRLLLVQLTLESGALAKIEVNAASGYGYEVAVKVVGELGSAQTLSLQSPTVSLARQHAQAVDPDWLSRFAQAYLKEAQAWIDSLLNEAPIGPTAWDGYMSLVVAEACRRSVQTGLPEDVPDVERLSLYQT